MSYKFKVPVEEYIKYLIPEMIKQDFEEYGFTMEYKGDVLNDLNNSHMDHSSLITLLKQIQENDKEN